MLSRLALNLRSAPLFNYSQWNPQLLRIATVTTNIAKPNAATLPVESGERDLVNFPQPKQALYGGKVRLAFLPDEWFQFFYKKTGVTGPYVFGTGLITFLYSKEWLIMEHEYHTGVCVAIFITILIKVFGPKVEVVLDKEQENMISGLKNYVADTKKHHEDTIKQEETEQWRTEAQKMLFDAKRENVALQLEAEYRRRLFNTYEEVKKRLDYHVQSLNAVRQVQHKHMVNWIIDNVVRSISPQQEEEALKKCISDLKMLSAAR